MIHYDLLEHGDLYIIGEWKKIDVVSGYKHTWEAEAEAIVTYKWAEALGIPHGTRIKGTFWMCTDEDGHPDEVYWKDWGIDNWEILEISPELIEDLADAVRDILTERDLTPQDLTDPQIAFEVWNLAWKSLQDGEYGPTWAGKNLDNMLREVSAGEVEELAIKLLEN